MGTEWSISRVLRIPEVPHGDKLRLERLVLVLAYRCHRELQGGMASGLFSKWSSTLIITEQLPASNCLKHAVVFCIHQKSPPPLEISLRDKCMCRMLMNSPSITLSAFFLSLFSSWLLMSIRLRLPPRSQHLYDVWL